MATSLKELGQIIQPKTSEPETTPSLRDALSHPARTIDSYYVTASIRAILKEIFDTATNRKGQGYWIRAEYGSGKTHFIAALTTLLTDRNDDVWNSLRDEETRRDYRAALSKLKLFPVTFSLLGAGEAGAADSLMRLFEKEIHAALPNGLRGRFSVFSEEHAVEWYQLQAGSLIKEAIAAHFKSAHKVNPDEFLTQQGARKFGAEIIDIARQESINIELKGAFRERFAYIYEQITKLGGYDGIVFVVDEFRSWQERHEGKPSFEEGVQVLETLAYYLPVEEHMNILTVVASQGDCPQKLMGSGRGDRFIVRELLSGKDLSDYGEIVCFRVRDVQPGKDIEIEEYYKFCRDNYRFLKQTPKDYFRSIFPFQPRCFDILRKVTQSYDRYGLPSTRSGIHIAHETLRNNGLLASARLAVLSDLLNSKTLTTGLRAQQFRASYDSYQYVLETIDTLPMDEEERETARRIVGTLYLWSVVNSDQARGMTLNELAEATLASLQGVRPDDAVLDLLNRLKSDIPQIRYDKEKGARFEISEIGSKQPERVFGTFKKKGKAEIEAQNKAWRTSLFWDFKTLEGAGSDQGFAGGFFDGYGNRDATGEIVLPHTIPVKATPADLKVQYGGEVIVSDKWQASFGEAWPNKPEIHFRIVYLTANASVDKGDQLDPRIALCIPASLSDDTRENLAELVGCNLMLELYNDRDYPGEGAMRDWAKARRRTAMAAVLKNQIEEYRRGAIITQKELGLPANQIFMRPQKSRGDREETLASELLENAYDAPLFNPKEFKKDFTDADARKVFHGLFAKIPAKADESARDNFAAGMGLVPKNNPTQFALQANSMVARIQDRAANAGDVALADLVKEFCQYPYGLTEDMVRLAILCAVRAGAPPLVLADLNPSAGFRLTTGKEPMGRRITSRLVSQVEWSTKIEKAFLGARLRTSDEKPFNDALPYAQIINPNLTAANTPDEESARNAELCLSLQSLGGSLPAVRDNLKKLASVLGGTLDQDTTEAFARLEAIAASNDYLEFFTVVRESYPTPELFKAGYEFYERGKRFTARYPELQSTKAYLDGLAKLDDAYLDLTAQNLLTQLEFKGLWNSSESALRAMPDSFRQFKDRYSLAYRKTHREFHQTLEALQKELAAVEDKLTVIDRLNGLEIGAPVGASLPQQVESMQSKVRPCALKDACQVEEKPRCGACHWDGKTVAPVDEVKALASRIECASRVLCKRVTQEAIRKILEQSAEPTVKTLLDMITASQIEELAAVLTPDMVNRIKGILAAANIEHRDLAISGLLEDVLAVEEDQVDDLLKRLRQRLLAAFDQAKKDTAGKKRIRFMLK